MFDFSEWSNEDILTELMNFHKRIVLMEEFTEEERLKFEHLNEEADRRGL